eukprot:2057521-Pleurochrysis_carterae.AAC.2
MDETLPICPSGAFVRGWRKHRTRSFGISSRRRATPAPLCCDTSRQALLASPQSGTPNLRSILFTALT